MDRIELLINDKLVRLDDSASVGVYSLTQESITEPLKYKTENAISVKAPFTKQNDIALEHINRVDRVVGNGLNPSKKTPFKIYLNGSLFREGYCKVNKTSDMYDITLYGKLGEFYDDLADIKLNTLTFDVFGGNPTLSHPVNKDHIIYNWQAAQAFPKDNTVHHNILRYIPTMQGMYKDFDSASVDRGGETVDKLDYNVDEFGACEFRSYKQKPALRVNKIVESIIKRMKEKGYTISSDFFNNNNPYYGDTMFMLQSFQDRSKTGDSSNADISKLDTVFGSLSTPYAYVSLTPKGENPENPVVNGKYDFSQHINSEAVVNTIVNCNIDVQFNGEAKNWDRFAYPEGWYDREFLFEVTPDQGTVTGGRIGLNLEDYAQDKIMIIVPKGTTKGHLCRELVEGEKDYVTNPEFGKVDGAPILNPEYDGRFGEVYWKLFTPYTANLNFGTEFKFKPTKNTTQKGSYRFKFKYDTTSEAAARQFRMWDDFAISHQLVSVMSFDVKTCTGAADLSFKSNIATNTVVDVKSLFDSEMTAKQFLLEYCRLFGLYFNIDKDSKRVEILTRTNFYKDSKDIVMDDKFCADLSHELQPVTFDNKYLHFNYKDDNNSEYTKRYKTIHNESYGTQVVDTGYNFSDKKLEVFETSIFNPLAMVEQYALPSYGGIVLPSLFEISGNERKAVDVKNCLIFDTKKKVNLGSTKFYVTDDTDNMSKENKPCWNQTRNSATSGEVSGNAIPFYSTFLEDKRCSLDIARPKSIWSGQSENNYPKEWCIFPRFHENFIKDRYNVNTKRFTGFFNLSYADLIGFSFRNFISFKGVLWTVENVDISLLEGKPSKLTLISVQDKRNYIANQNMDVPYLNILNSEIQSDYVGKDYYTSVFSSSSWTATSDSEWIVLTSGQGVNGGNIYFNTLNNELDIARVGHITITNQDGYSTVLTVRQKEMFVPYLTFSTGTVELVWDDERYVDVYYYSNMSDNDITFSCDKTDEGGASIFTVDTERRCLRVHITHKNTFQGDVLYAVKGTILDYLGKVTESIFIVKHLKRPIYIEFDTENVDVPWDSREVFEVGYEMFTDKDVEFVSLSEDVEIVSVDKNIQKVKFRVNVDNDSIEHVMYKISGTVEDFEGHKESREFNITHLRRPPYINVVDKITMYAAYFEASITYETNIESVYSSVVENPNGAEYANYTIKSHVGNTVVISIEDLPSVGPFYSKIKLEGEGVTKYITIVKYFDNYDVIITPPNPVMATSGIECYTLNDFYVTSNFKPNVDKYSELHAYRITAYLGCYSEGDITKLPNNTYVSKFSCKKSDSTNYTFYCIDSFGCRREYNNIFDKKKYRYPTPPNVVENEWLMARETYIAWEGMLEKPLDARCDSINIYYPYFINGSNTQSSPLTSPSFLLDGSIIKVTQFFNDNECGVVRNMHTKRYSRYGEKVYDVDVKFYFGNYGTRQHTMKIRQHSYRAIPTFAVGDFNTSVNYSTNISYELGNGMFIQSPNIGDLKIEDIDNPTYSYTISYTSDGYADNTTYSIKKKWYLKIPYAYNTRRLYNLRFKNVTPDGTFYSEPFTLTVY